LIRNSNGEKTIREGNPTIKAGIKRSVLGEEQAEKRAAMTPEEEEHLKDGVCILHRQKEIGYFFDV